VVPRRSGRRGEHSWLYRNSNSDPSVVQPIASLCRTRRNMNEGEMTYFNVASDHLLRRNEENCKRICHNIPGPRFETRIRHRMRSKSLVSFSRWVFGFVNILNYVCDMESPVILSTFLQFYWIMNLKKKKKTKTDLLGSKFGHLGESSTFGGTYVLHIQDRLVTLVRNRWKQPLVMRQDTEERTLHTYRHGNMKSDEWKRVSTCASAPYDIRKLGTFIERFQTGTSVCRITVTHSSMKASD
jgi:hypothetical protein